MPAVELLGLGRHGEPTDKERQPFQLIPGQVREVKDVTVDVDPNEERGDLEALDGAWRRERELDGGNRMGPAGRTDLDAAGAEIDTRRLPFAAAGVANPHGERDPRSNRKSCKTVPTDRSSSTIRTRILGSAQQEEYQRLPGISGGTSGAFPGDVRDKRWRYRWLSNGLDTLATADVRSVSYR